jgi:precorrin-6B methylase 1
MVIMKKHFLVIAGCGAGSSDGITPEVRGAVDWAEVLVGDQRLLALFPESRAEKIAAGDSVENVLQEIESRRAIKRIVILVTGNPVLSSLAEPLIGRFGRETCRFIPGAGPT